MRYHEMARDDAYVAIKKRQPKIYPNPGFWKQLKEYEEDALQADESVVASGRITIDAVWAKESTAMFAACRDIEISEEEFRHLLWSIVLHGRQ